MFFMSNQGCSALSRYAIYAFKKLMHCDDTCLRPAQVGCTEININLASQSNLLLKATKDKIKKSTEY